MRKTKTSIDLSVKENRMNSSAELTAGGYGNVRTELQGGGRKFWERQLELGGLLVAV